ncbi:discoidin domain-containing protein [Fictibacillus sp. 7GRE50]|uniref:Gp37-like protein n=1 Tax=Fictibacillus sp. 7GRE50 TaxID=2745878 RepID=UPI0018CCC9A4|nr:discoidin domain-containing protein [Fictibacillus sp. 7GRE50]MBH0166286.1 discoidin domain-containing protein [Fictibacillus sp. 7GRE50]
MKPIRILSPNVDLLAEIDNYESMYLIRRFHGIGEIEVRINRYKKHTNLLVKGNLFIVGSSLNKAYIIKHREIELDQDGKITENWLIRGFSLKSILGQRITVPPLTTAYDNKQGNAETVMKHYVDGNAVNALDPTRDISQLIIATNQNRGSTVSWQSRFKNLAEEMTSISLVSGLGWGINLDYSLKKWVFDCHEGRDLTVNQSILPPVIFSPQFDSLKSLHYTESELNYKNTAYVAGQGEGIQRRVIELNDTNSGLNRHEIFVDARDVPEETEGDEPTYTNEIGAGTASANAYTSGYPPSSAFDGNLGTTWGNTSSMPSWLQYDFGTGKTIAKYRIYYEYGVSGWDSYDYSPSIWEFQGSNDNASWTTLDTQTGQGWDSDGWKEYALDNTTPFRYYRLYVTSSKNSLWCTVMEMQMLSLVVSDSPQPRPVQDIESDLTIRGQQKLTEYEQEVYLEGQILTSSPFKYEIDYDLGDIVTIQNKDWNITQNSRITEIKEIYEVSGFQLEATFGVSRPTFIDKVKQEIGQAAAEIRK